MTYSTVVHCIDMTMEEILRLRKNSWIHWEHNGALEFTERQPVIMADMHAFSDAKVLQAKIESTSQRVSCDSYWLYLVCHITNVFLYFSERSNWCRKLAA